MRPQYHLRPSGQGLLAWDVRHLVIAAADCTPLDLPLSEIRELDEPFWFEHEGDTPTCRSIAGHANLIAACDLAYPIILDPDGRVMDGMHRVCKALMEGRTTISAVKLGTLPEPDFTGIPANRLPYD